MKLVTLNLNKLVIGTSRPDSTVEAPDYVECYWQQNGETWEKSAELLAIEALSADLATKRSNINGDVSTLRTWADFHENIVFDGGDASTTAEKLAWTKTLHRRFGIFLRRFADFYQGYQFKP